MLNLQPEIDKKKEDIKFLLRFVPEWALKTEPNLNPTFYGTGSYNSDLEIVKRIQQIKDEIGV